MVLIQTAIRLYELIRNQFIACQMTEARYLSTNIKVAAGEFELSIRGRILQFDGYTKVMAPNVAQGRRFHTT